MVINDTRTPHHRGLGGERPELGGAGEWGGGVSEARSLITGEPSKADTFARSVYAWLEMVASAELADDSISVERQSRTLTSHPCYIPATAFRLCPLAPLRQAGVAGAARPCTRNALLHHQTRPLRHDVSSPAALATQTRGRQHTSPSTLSSYQCRNLKFSHL